MWNETSFAGKRVLVTAGADGIGLAITRAFAAAGARVFVCDVQTASLERAMACLLYTSPSPRDRTRSRMPSSA